MSDPYARLFLAHVSQAMNQQARDHDSCTALLQSATPDFRVEGLADRRTREQAVKALKLRLHPDKHGGSVVATNLFQDVDSFVAECLEAGERPRPASASRTSTQSTSNKRRRQQDHVDTTSSSADVEPEPESDIPDEFNFFHHYAHLEVADADVWSEFWHGPSSSALDDARRMALNWSAQRAQGRPLELYWHPGVTVPQLETFSGLSRIGLKRRIVENGPLVSTSFVPTAQLAQVCPKKAFRPAHIGRPHPVLICGWQYTPHGEAWLIKPLGPSDTCPTASASQPRPHYEPGVDVLSVAVGQFQLADEIECASWEFVRDQKFQAGPYLSLLDPPAKLAEIGNAWWTLSRITWSCTAAQLPLLFTAIASADPHNSTGVLETTMGIGKAIKSEAKVELHLPGLRAMCRPVKLAELQYDVSENRYRAELVFL
ncbi:unnamed protein product [Amoebophrya sp. A120]|nr:unnamed protein product [Amoebophrya sp. A120]|eukprot:GSA120T00018994001.1